MTNPDEFENYTPEPAKIGPVGEVKAVWDKIVTRGSDGLFRDSDGCIYALAEKGKPWSMDGETRAGVGLFSLSKDNLLSIAAPAHDYLTSCPAYQMFHYRVEGDQLFLNHVRILGATDKHEEFWEEVARLFLQRHSDGYWEIDKTAWGGVPLDDKTIEENVP